MQDAISEPLWEDEEFVLARRRASDGGSSFVLELRSVSAHPSPATLDRLEREHQLSSLLSSDWAVRPSSFSRRDGRPLLVLDDPGGQLLARHVGRPWPVADFLKVALASIGAVRELHALGIVHRDIRPRNLFFDLAAGRVWLTGFGTAARVARQRGALEPNREPNGKGSPAYMAPELVS